MNIKAIETQYKGYRFRSRLEARWAVFLDTAKVVWEYEKEGYDLGEFGWYLPDFYLPDLGFWLEIKPDEPTEIERQRAASLSHGLQQHVVIQIGMPFVRYNHAFGVWETDNRKGIEVFAGNATDKFVNRYMPAVIEYIYGDSEFESLAEMLSERLGERVTFDGSDASVEQIAALDTAYFQEKYGRTHWRWQWGRHMKFTLWHADGSGEMFVDPDGVTNEFAARAYEAARSARFEHGEKP